MQFKEWLGDGVQLFHGMLNNLHDQYAVFVFCDWLEENGFIETSHWIRNRITGKSVSYWGKMAQELLTNKMKLSSDGLTVTDHQNPHIQFMVAHHKVLKRNFPKWQECSPEEYKDFIPALAVTVFANYSNQKQHSHGNRVYGGLLSTKLTIFRKILSLDDESINKSTFFYIRKLCEETKDLINHLENKKELSNLLHDLSLVIDAIIDTIDDDKTIACLENLSKLCVF